MAENENNNGEMPSGKPFMKRPKFNLFWAYGLIAIIVVMWGLFDSSGDPIKSNWDNVREMIANGDVDRIEVINKEVAEVYLKDSAIQHYAKEKQYKSIPEVGSQFTYTIPSVDIFDREIETVKQETGQNVKVSYETRRNVWMDVLTSILPIALIIGVWLLIMRGMSRGGGGGGGGVFNVGKARAQVFDKDGSVNVTFKDVAGLEEAKVEIMEIVDFLKRPQKYKDLGGKIPKGALLVGPPGTGKTLLAKAVAGEANVPFFSISGSDFVEMFVGVGASRVRDLFRQAKEKAPCIVFIDEIDAIGRARGKNAGFSSNDERENTLNQLLTEMDGFGTNAGVIILAATNRADILDKALLRAGRFDRQIEVGLPDLKERKEIFDVHLQKLKLADGLDREFLAKQTPGFSGADIANVCNEAALIAARNNKSAVDKEDFLNAIDRIIGGLERKSTIISKDEKKMIAYHEAGHATVSWILENAHPLIKVTIIPRGKALGAAWYLPEERQIVTREQMMEQMAATLGGRVSEKVFFGEMSTGAQNDLERVTKMAYAMVAYYGMSDKVGTVSFYDSTGQSDMSFSKPYSEQTALDIDNEAKHLIEEAYKMAQEVVEQKKSGLIELAELLLEREVVFTEDLERIFGKRKKDIQREKEEAEAKAIEAVKKAEEDKKAEEVKKSADAEDAAETKPTEPIEVIEDFSEMIEEGKEGDSRGDVKPNGEGDAEKSGENRDNK